MNASMRTWFGRVILGAAVVVAMWPCAALAQSSAAMRPSAGDNAAWQSGPNLISLVCPGEANCADTTTPWLSRVQDNDTTSTSALTVSVDEPVGARLVDGIPLEGNGGFGSYAGGTGARREVCDLAVEFGKFRIYNFSQDALTSDTLDVPINGNDRVTVTVVVTANDAASASTQVCVTDDIEADAMGNDTPNLAFDVNNVAPFTTYDDEWVVEVLVDTDGNGTFDANDIDACDGAVPTVTDTTGNLMPPGNTITVSVADAAKLRVGMRLQDTSAGGGLLDEILEITSIVGTTVTFASTATQDHTPGVNQYTLPWPCGIIPAVESSQAGAPPQTFTTGDIISPLLAGGLDLTNFNINEHVWVRARAQRQDPASSPGSTVEISDVRMDVTFLAGPSGPLTAAWFVGPQPLLKGTTCNSPQRLQVSGGTPSYAWAVTAGSLPPGVSGGPTDCVPASGLTDCYDFTSTPATQAGTFYLTLQVTDSTGTPNVEDFNVRLDVDGLELAVEGVVGATSINTPIPGEPYLVALSAVKFDVGGAGSTNLVDWSVAGVLPPGLSLPAATGQSTNALFGTPTGGAYNFTLTIDDPTAFSGASGCLAADENTAFVDVESFTGDEDVRILAQTIPPAIQGMAYTSTDPAAQGYDVNLPPLATLQAVNATTPLAVEWTATTTSSLPPGLESNPLRLVEVSGPVPNEQRAEIIGTLTSGGTVGIIPLESSVAGTHTFTAKATDVTASPPKEGSREFEIRVLPRETLLLSGPSGTVQVPSETAGAPAVVTYTVFAQGGVPTYSPALNSYVDETRSGAAGTPHYELQYRVDPQIIAQDEPANAADIGKYKGDGDVLTAAFQTKWMNPVAGGDLQEQGWVPFPNNAIWPGYTSPAIISIDLENDANIVDGGTTMRPSAGSGRRYRIQFRAADAIGRDVDNLLTDLGLTDANDVDFPAVQNVVTVVAGGGGDANPDATRPIRIRQERFD